VSRRKAFYKARIPRSEVGFWLLNQWELDPDTLPTASFVTVLWMKPTRPSALPVGYTTCGGLWQ
jgi:hypothetical protein